jgi:hypothetical protein
LNAEDTSKFTTDIEVTGDIPLDYGFSDQKPSSLKKTVKKPIKGMRLFFAIFIIISLKAQE